VTRKFVYDPHVERVRMVAWTTGSDGPPSARRWRSLRWLMAALVVIASALAFGAAHAAAEAAHAEGRRHDPPAE
jgi:hypothetical protein